MVLSFSVGGTLPSQVDVEGVLPLQAGACLTHDSSTEHSQEILDLPGSACHNQAQITMEKIGKSTTDYSGNVYACHGSISYRDAVIKSEIARS